MRQQIFDGLAALPDRYRAPLVLRYYADLDYDAIGDVLGVTRNQVATLLYRGKQRLRDALASDAATGAELVEFRIPSPGSRR